MAVVPGTKESYIGALLENILYGVYLSVFSECCLLFWKKRDARGGVHVYLLATTGIMFLLITLRCIIDTYRCVAAFNNGDVNYGPLNSPLGLVTNTCLVLILAVADVFIVFRTFIVWDRNWLIIIIPSLSCLANTIIGIFGLVSLAELGRSNAAFWSEIDWLNAWYSLTLATNVVCTGLISFRIIQVYRRVAWMVSSASTPGRKGSLRALSIIVESAAIYTALLLATLVVARTRGFAIFVLLDCLPPTIGLVFSYIIIRVSRGTSYGESTANTNGTTLSHRRNIRTFETGQNLSSQSGTRPEVQIRLEQTTDGSVGLEMDGVSPNYDLSVAKYAAA